MGLIPEGGLRSKSRGGRRSLLRSKPLVLIALALFITFLIAESLPLAGSQAQSQYQKVFQAGKKLYDDGEHKEAIIRFLEALNLSKITAEMSEANLYIALCYYALGR